MDYSVSKEKLNGFHGSTANHGVKPQYQGMGRCH
jgi:hypothetical protein